MKSIIKKVIAAIIAASLALSLCACGNDEKNAGSKEKTETASAPLETSEEYKTEEYKSERFNLSFTPPEGYVMLSDSQKSAQMNGSKNTTCEMISEHNDGFPQVKVVFEKFDGDEAAYADYLKNTFANSGMEATYTDVAEKTIGGQSFLGFSSVIAESFNMEFYAKKFDDGILCISVSALVGGVDGTTVLDAFKPIK